MRYLILLSSLLFANQVASQVKRAGMDRALFFAVNDYQKMTDLKNPIKNAQDLAAELEKRYGFLAEVVLNPTLETIENKIATYKRNYANGTFKPNGQLFVFFTGHGVMKGKNGYFMPTNANPNRPHVSAIEYDYWRDEINGIDCKHILVAVDACHSITFDPSWENNKSDRNFNRPGEQFSDQVLLNHQSYRARLFFTSDAVGNQTPDRSTFAEQLLTGLRTHSSTNGYMTSSELFASYLKKAAPTPGGGSFGADEAGSTFLFFRKLDVNISAARSDKETWQNAQQRNNIDAYRQYLAAHPNGDFASIAEQKLSQLVAEGKELQDWQQAKTTHTSKSYQEFMQKYPNSPYREVAILHLKEVAPRPEELGHMVFVEGGDFQMGSNIGKQNERPHTVILSDYYIGRYEVTFEEYSIFCAATGKEKPAEIGLGREKHPVSNVNWYDALEYCNWLSKREGLQKVYIIDKSRKDPNNKSQYDNLKWSIGINWKANGYRLPTETEWEYAARSRGEIQNWAGTSNENRLASYGNYNKNSNDYEDTTPVGTFKANDLGMFDMSGNVWEWCWDWFGNYSENTVNNPRGPDTGSSRIRRGGSWDSKSGSIRCSFRFFYSADFRRSYIGFRLSRTSQ